MERTFALIKGTTVENHIVADDSFVEYIKNQYDAVIETTDIKFKPSPGFALLEDGSFSNPMAVWNFTTDTLPEPEAFIEQEQEQLSIESSTEEVSE